jgi:hypothetical protein
MPSVIFTSAKQPQLARLEQSLSPLLDFGAHLLNSRMDGPVVHQYDRGPNFAIIGPVSRDPNRNEIVTFRHPRYHFEVQLPDAAIVSFQNGDQEVSEPNLVAFHSSLEDWHRCRFATQT